MKRRLASTLLCLAAATAAAQPPAGFDERVEAAKRRGFNWPDEALHELDALAAAAPSLPGAQRSLMIARGEINAGAGRAEAALAQADALAALGQRERDGLALGGAELVRAQLAMSQGRLDAAGESARGALSLAKAACARRGEGEPRCDHRVAWDSLDIIARYEDSRGVNVAARTQMQAAYELARDAGDLDRQARSVASQAYYTAVAGESDNAWRQYAQAERLARQSGDAELMVRVKLYEASIASRLGQLDHVRRASEENLPLARAARVPRLEARVLTNLSDALVKTRHPAEALQAVEQALPIVHRYKDARSERVLLNNGGLAKIGLGRIADGRADMEKLLEQRGRVGAIAEQAHTLREFSDALSEAGDVKGALELYHRERALTEEFMALNRKTALDELHQRYDREAKQRSIELLGRDNALKSAELEIRSLQQRVWLAAAALLTFAAVLVALLYRRVRETNRKLAESHAWLRVQSQRDPLTGLANRRHFQDVMHGLDGWSSAPSAFEGALLLVDVDHFKQVNDGYGHDAGDHVLKEIARRLKDVVRAEDLVVRWGGEEFLIFAPHVSAVQAEGLAERVLRGIGDAAAPLPEGRTLRVTVSIGYARFPLPPHELRVAWEQAVNLADMALYTAKSQGRNRAVGIESIAAAHADVLRDVESDFERAWGEGRVTLRQTPGPQPA
jgi:diguanylate cyclase (GGDEF)-like protein